MVTLLPAKVLSSANGKQQAQGWGLHRQSWRPQIYSCSPPPTRCQDKTQTNSIQGRMRVLKSRGRSEILR